MRLREVSMPKLGHLMEEGRVACWSKNVGEAVGKGEALLEVETDKAVIEVEAPVSGRLHSVLVAQGETVPVGASIALIEVT